ncbi:MAG: hypothetical protein AAGK32_18535, partial [Actinomycetota bacterium]
RRLRSRPRRRRRCVAGPGSVTEPYVLHWTGPCRTGTFAEHDFGSVLEHFESSYYAATPDPGPATHRRCRRGRERRRRWRKRAARLRP